MVSAANNDATEQIINVWSFMIIPWGQKYMFFFIDIIWDSPELLFPGLKGVTKLGQIISIFPCSPSICLAADREKVYINR